VPALRLFLNLFNSTTGSLLIHKLPTMFCSLTPNLDTSCPLVLSTSLTRQPQVWKLSSSALEPLFPMPSYKCKQLTLPCIRSIKASNIGYQYICLQQLHGLLSASLSFTPSTEVLPLPKICKNTAQSPCVSPASCTSIMNVLQVFFWALLLSRGWDANGNMLCITPV
jgi:hypothetical protein